MNVLSNEISVILNKFSNYLLNIKNYSSLTVKEYIIDLMMFFRFIKDYCEIGLEVEEFNIFILLSVKQSDIIAFMVYLNYNKNCTASTRKRKMCAIKAFYKWLFTFYPTGDLKNPSKGLPVVQDIHRLPKYLSLEEAKSLVNVFNCNNSKFSVRNNAIIGILLNCGLRASELANINLCDLHLKEKYICIIGKNNKERIVYLNSTTKKKIEEYLKIRNNQKEVINMNDALFLSYRKGRLSLRTVENIVMNAYKLAKLQNCGYTTHTLRHTTATMIYKYVKPDVLLLKELLGHSTVKSTEIYTHVDNKDIRKAFESNPLGNFIPNRKVA